MSEVKARPGLQGTFCRQRPELDGEMLGDGVPGQRRVSSSSLFTPGPRPARAGDITWALSSAAFKKVKIKTSAIISSTVWIHTSGLSTGKSTKGLSRDFSESCPFRLPPPQRTPLLSCLVTKLVARLSGCTEGRPSGHPGPRFLPYPRPTCQGFGVTLVIFTSSYTSCFSLTPVSTPWMSQGNSFCSWSHLTTWKTPARAFLSSHTT